MKNQQLLPKGPNDLIDSPEVVYKYRDWAKIDHQNWLKNKEIYFASPTKFNDPFDCNIPITLDGISKKHLKQIATRMVYDLFDGEKISYAKRQSEINRVYERLLDPKLAKRYSMDILSNLRQNWGICSFAEEIKSILMWAHYTNNHEGFCIGYDLRNLCFSIQQIGIIGKVNYKPKIEAINPINSLYELAIPLKVFFTKHDSWKYEKEFRIISEGLVNQKLKISSKFITEIIVGYRTKTETIESIRDILNSEEELAHVKLFRATPNFNSFELDLIPL